MVSESRLSAKSTSAPPSGGSCDRLVRPAARARLAPAWSPGSGILGRRRQIGIEIDRAEIQTAVELGHRAREVGDQLALGLDRIEPDRGIGERDPLRRGVELARDLEGAQALALEGDRLGQPGRQIADRADLEVELARRRPARAPLPSWPSKPTSAGVVSTVSADRRRAALEQRRRLVGAEPQRDRLALVVERAVGLAGGFADRAGAASC